MKTKLTEEEVELIIDMMNFADDPCAQSFWELVLDEDGEEEYGRLREMSYDIREKLRNIE